MLKKINKITLKELCKSICHKTYEGHNGRVESEWNPVFQCCARYSDERRNKRARSEPWTMWLLWDRQCLQHSRGDKVRRAISPEASGLHWTQLKVNGWSVFPHACTLFKTPGSSSSKAFQTQEPQRSLLKQYLLLFQWDGWTPKKKIPLNLTDPPAAPCFTDV